MKNKLKYLAVIALAAFAFAGCQKLSTEGMTRITIYPELALKGSSIVTAELGSTFTDPGYTATLDGEEAYDKVNVTSNVDMSKAGVYTIKYSIENADGLAMTQTRTVVVANPEYPLEGGYLTDSDSFRDASGTIVVYGEPFQIIVRSRGDGTYTIDDLYGGYYCDRAGYGAAYKMSGVIAVDGSAVTMISSSQVPWGDTASGLDNGKFDDATDTLSYELGYAGYTFHVTMNKQ